MTNRERLEAMDKYAELDIIVGEEFNGIYVEPSFDEKSNYDFIGQREYCQKKGIDFNDLTDEECAMFIIESVSKTSISLREEDDN